MKKNTNNPYLKESKGKKFSPELHAVRGIAAVFVLFIHIQDKIQEAFPDMHISTLINGSIGVVYFFVLSGLVVGMSLSRSWGNQGFLEEFAVKRFFRIMPLMFVMTTIGGLYVIFVNPHMPFSLYRREFGDFSIVKMISGYIGYSAKSNPLSWSIFVELVASLFIPLMIFCGNKKSWIAISFIFFLLLPLIHLDTQHQWHMRITTFYTGLTILLWGEWFCSKLRKLEAYGFWSVIAIIFLCTYLPRLVLNINFYGNPWIVYWETLFVSLIVAIIFYMPEKFAYLAKKLFQFLGDISYGLYLTHMIFINALFNIIALTVGINSESIWAFIIISVVCSFPIALLVYKVIELPGIALGKKAWPDILRQINFLKAKFVRQKRIE